MVCSPHQYTLQKIAMPAYMPSAAYLTQTNYLQKPVYQFRPQQELYRLMKTNLREMPTYQTQKQYAQNYGSNENQRKTDENFQFTAPVWIPVPVDSAPAISERSVSPTWNDYGVPFYSTPRIVIKTSEQQQQEPKIDRDDLLQRIQQELAAMKQRKKLQEDYLCAA